MTNRMQLGCFSAAVIKTLNLDISPGTPIYIAESNIKHMKASHPTDFSKYGDCIADIIAHPDYVGQNTKDQSIEFTKEYQFDGEFVKVAVRVTARNVYYARSLYILNPKRVHNFLRKGTLKKLDKH